MDARTPERARWILAVAVFAFASPGFCSAAPGSDPDTRQEQVARAYQALDLAMEAARAASTTDKKSSGLFLPEFLKATLRAQALAGDVAGATRTAEVLRREEPDAQRHGQASILAARARSGDVAGAAKAAGELQDAAARDWVLGDIVLAQARAGDPDGALRLAGTIADQEWRLTAVLGVALLRVRAGDTAGALKLLETSDAAREGLAGLRKDGELPGVKATMVDAPVLIQHLKRALLDPTAAAGSSPLDDVVGLHAYAVHSWVQLHEFSTCGYATGLKAASGDKAGADAITQYFLKGARMGKGEGEGSVIPGVVEGLALAGDTVRASQVAGAAKLRDVRSAALSTVAAAQASRGDVAAALKTAAGIETRPVRAITLPMVAEYQARSGDREGARRTLAEATEVTGKTTTTEYRAYALCRIALAQAALGDKAQAMESARKAAALGPRFEATLSRGTFLAKVCRVVIRIGELEAALTMAEGMAGRGTNDADKALRAVAEAAAKAGSRDLAVKAYARLRAYAAGSKNEGARQLMLQETARSEGASLDPAPVLAWAQGLRSPSDRAYALFGLAEAQFRGLYRFLDDGNEDPRDPDGI